MKSLEGSDFRTATSGDLQKDVAIGVLNSANVISKEKKRPKKPVWECPPPLVSAADACLAQLGSI